MIIGRLRFLTIFKKSCLSVNRMQIAWAGGSGGGHCAQPCQPCPPLSLERQMLGNRDYVGFGINGTVHYIDRMDMPFPSIRFRENTNELLALREKERGDWRKLCCEEKKTLYRASFRQTFVEVQAPTGEWKEIVAGWLFLMTLVVWIYFFEREFVLLDFPATFTDENRAKYLRFVLDGHHGAITGLSSKWDYENDDWKK